MEYSPTPSCQKIGTTQIVTEIVIEIAPDIKLPQEILPEIDLVIAIRTEIAPVIKIIPEMMQI